VLGPLRPVGRIGVGTLRERLRPGFPQKFHHDDRGTHMTITEESRYRLFKRLEQTLGADDANTLMEHLPPVGWSDVATKVDLDHLHAATQADLAEVRGDVAQLLGATRADIAELRGDIALLRTTTQADTAQLRTTMESEFSQVRSDICQLGERMTMHVDTALAQGLHRQFVQLIASTAAMFAIWSTIIVLLGR